MSLAISHVSSCNRRLIPSMASSTLLSPSGTSKPCSLHCDSFHRRSVIGLQNECIQFSSCEKGFFALSSRSRSQATCCCLCCRDCARSASYLFRVCANSASMVSSLFSPTGIKLRTLSGFAGSSASQSTSRSRRNRTQTRASSTSVDLSPKKKINQKSEETPAILQPSLTWGVVPYSAEGKQKVLEFLKKEGIDTCELIDVELPNTIEVMQERLDFLKKLGLSLETINSYPLMVTCSIKKNLIPVLDYLERLGLRARDLPKFVEKYPMVLHSSVIIDLMPVVDYLLGLDIQRKDIIKVLARYPDVLGFRLEGTMSTSVAYLVSLGVRTRSIGRMLTEYPEILGMRVAKSIKPKVDFLTSHGIPKAVVARLLERRPYMLGFDLSETMEAVVDDLVDAGVRKEGIAAIITQYPDILGQGIRQNLNRKTKWLVEQVEIDPENVPIILEKLPQILFIKEELAMERVKFFKNAGCSAKDVAKMVTDCPHVLALSIAKVIEPSLNYLLHHMKRSVKDVVNFPAYFTYDLKSRIIPRYNMIAEKDVECSLEWFLNCTDQRFRVRLSDEYMDEDGPGPVFQMGGIVHTEIKPVEEDSLLEKELDSKTNRQGEKRKAPRSSPARRREATKMHQPQRVFETDSDIYSEDDEDPDDDTDGARNILRARLQDDEDLEELESESEFDVSEEEEGDDDDEDEDWDMPEMASEFDKSGEDFDDDESDEVSEEEIMQPRATNKSNR